MAPRAVRNALLGVLKDRKPHFLPELLASVSGLCKPHVADNYVKKASYYNQITPERRQELGQELWLANVLSNLKMEKRVAGGRHEGFRLINWYCANCGTFFEDEHPSFCCHECSELLNGFEWAP